MNKKILLAHPLVQHSYRTANAIILSDSLKSYYTTIYYDSNKLFYKFLEKILSEDNIKRMKKKKMDLLDFYQKTCFKYIGLMYLFIIRKDIKKIIEPSLYMLLTRIFGKKIYNILKKEDNMIIWMYDTTAWNCFPRIDEKSKHIKVIDMSSAAAPYIRKIILNEINNSPMYRKSLEIKLKSYKKSYCLKYQEEIDNTDYFVVPSNFSANSLIDCGVERKKIFIIPYGVDVSIFNNNNKKYLMDKKIKFLYVGRIEAVKGVHHLVEVFKNINIANIELTLVGAMQGGMGSIFDNLPDNIMYIGPKRHDEMPDLYKEYDVLIAPSLWDGFSLTVFEAMASGLAIIASSNVGAATFLEGNNCGCLYEAGNKKDLKEKIEWFINNKIKIAEMGTNSTKVVKNYTWDNYNKKIKNFLEIINNN